MSCGGSNVSANLTQGTTSCTTDGSGNFNRGDELTLSGGDCRDTKFNPWKNIDVTVYEKSENWCMKKGESVIIHLDNNIIFSAKFNYGFDYQFSSLATYTSGEKGCGGSQVKLK